MLSQPPLWLARRHADERALQSGHPVPHRNPTTPTTMSETPFPLITTPRLRLREIVIDDAEALFAIHGNRTAMQYFGTETMRSPDEARQLVAVFASWRGQASPGCRWGMEEHGSTRLIGSCGLFRWRQDWRSCTTGFELHPDAQGRGLMREALQAVFDWGFANMQLNRIEAQVHIDNHPSRKLLASLGFRQEGLQRQAGFWHERFHDLRQYALLQQEWLQPSNIPAAGPR